MVQLRTSFRFALAFVCALPFAGCSGEDPPPDPGDAPFCGGIAGFPCPGEGVCLDDPRDDCDPDRGGADCGGYCRCDADADCERGYRFDDSPEVCACVPAVDACATVRCREGFHCEVNDDGAAECVLRKLTFNPGKRDGQAIEAQATLPITFKLES